MMHFSIDCRDSKINRVHTEGRSRLSSFNLILIGIPSSFSVVVPTSNKRTATHLFTIDKYRHLSVFKGILSCPIQGDYTLLPFITCPERRLFRIAGIYPLALHANVNNDTGLTLIQPSPCSSANMSKTVCSSENILGDRLQFHNICILIFSVADCRVLNLCEKAGKRHS